MNQKQLSLALTILVGSVLFCCKTNLEVVAPGASLCPVRNPMEGVPKGDLKQLAGLGQLTIWATSYRDQGAFSACRNRSRSFPSDPGAKSSVRCGILSRGTSHDL